MRSFSVDPVGEDGQCSLTSTLFWQELILPTFQPDVLVLLITLKKTRTFSRNRNQVEQRDHHPPSIADMLKLYKHCVTIIVRLCSSSANLHLLLSGFFEELLLLTQQFFLGNTQSIELTLTTLAMFLLL